MTIYGVWFITYEKELDGEPFITLEGLYTSEVKAKQARDMLNHELQGNEEEPYDLDFPEDEPSEEDEWGDDVEADYSDHYEVWPIDVEE